MGGLKFQIAILFILEKGFFFWYGDFCRYFWGSPINRIIRIGLFYSDMLKV